MLFWALIGTLFAGLASFLVFLIYFFKGQFDHSEDVKYQIFRCKDSDAEV